MKPRMFNRLSRTKNRHERGATAVEYALLVALIAGVIIITVAALGQTLNGQFSLMNDGF